MVGLERPSLLEELIYFLELQQLSPSTYSKHPSLFYSVRVLSLAPRVFYTLQSTQVIEEQTSRRAQGEMTLSWAK